MKDLRRESSALVPRAMLIKVDSIEADEAAKKEGQQLKAIERKIKERFVVPKRAMDVAKRALLDLEQDLLASVSKGLKHISDQCVAWKNLQDEEAEKVRLEEQAALQEKARLANEADARAAEAAKQPELAKEIRDEPVETPLPAARPLVAKVRGATIPDTWAAEVIDYPANTAKFLELVVHVAQNPDLIHVLLPNYPSLNKLATAQKQGLKLPGVRAVRKQSMRLS